MNYAFAKINHELEKLKLDRQLRVVLKGHNDVGYGGPGGKPVGFWVVPCDAMTRNLARDPESGKEYVGDFLAFGTDEAIVALHEYAKGQSNGNA